MKLIQILAGTLFLTAQLHAQNYIGMPKAEIIKLMQKNNPGFDQDESAVNSTYNYLKFVDKYNEETWLFFLNEDNTCSISKLMSDYSNLKIRTDELGKKYKSAGENKWVCIEKGVVYTIELKKEEWFFTILMKKKK